MGLPPDNIWNKTDNIWNKTVIACTRIASFLAKYMEHDKGTPNNVQATHVNISQRIMRYGRGQKACMHGKGWSMWSFKQHSFYLCWTIFLLGMLILNSPKELNVGLAG